MCDKSNQPMVQSNGLLTEDNHHLFKVFNFNDTELRYTAFNERKVRKIVAHNPESLKFWIINKLIPEIALKKDYRTKYLETQLQKFNALAVGDVVYWIEGYNCTLYQFGKVIKKTAKTIINFVKKSPRLRDLILMKVGLTLPTASQIIKLQKKDNNNSNTTSKINVILDMNDIDTKTINGIQQALQSP